MDNARNLAPGTPPEEIPQSNWPASPHAPPPSRLNRALPIILQGSSWVVVEKPSGLLSVPGRAPNQHDCVRLRVQEMFPSLTALTVHRLDWETSGVIIVALSESAHRDLNQQFERRRISKMYTAIVSGLCPHTSGIIRLPIAKDWPNRPRQKVDNAEGKPTETHYRVIDSGPGWSRIEFMPITGRTHQIRVHAAHPEGLHAPILGDALYGDPASAPRLMLHATSIAFRDPETGLLVEARSSPPF
ncbi:MAG: RluA family pseudouridine synthase [Phycisphaeraceae bacterium]|nr:RluA family pseudouridine synthase [Phycisphaeraceae bacterium]